jgi:hypothetical protein
MHLRHEDHLSLKLVETPFARRKMRPSFLRSEASAFRASPSLPGLCPVRDADRMRTFSAAPQRFFFALRQL